MSEETLDDILAGPAEAPVAEAAPKQPLAPETDADGPERDEQGRFAAKTGVEEAVPPTDKLPQEDYKAIREEREKRQALERDMEALKAQLQSLQQPNEPDIPPSLWEDENKWGAQLVSQAVSQAEQKTVMRMSEMMARQAEPEFDTLKAEFLALAEANPALAEQAIADPHPWNKAISIARNHKKMQELGAVNVSDLEAKIRAQIMGEMQAIPPARPGLPPTLTTERSVGGRSGPAWAGPASLDELLRTYNPRFAHVAMTSAFPVPVLGRARWKLRNGRYRSRNRPHCAAVG